MFFHKSIEHFEEFLLRSMMILNFSVFGFAFGLAIEKQSIDVYVVMWHSNV